MGFVKNQLIKLFFSEHHVNSRGKFRVYFNEGFFLNGFEGFHLNSVVDQAVLCLEEKSRFFCEQ